MSEFSASDHARLMRAGTQSSASWVKLAEAVCDLVLWLGQHIPKTMRLPDHVTVFYNCEGDEGPYSITWFDIKDPADREHSLHSDERPDRDEALNFCDFLVKYDWLNKVSRLLEAEATRYDHMITLIKDSLPPQEGRKL